MATNYRTYPVLAAAYPKGSKLDSCLTHVCELDAKGYAVKVLCKRVKLDHICADECAGDVNEPATCEACASKDPRHPTRERKEALIWRHTHKDFRSTMGGYKSILIYTTKGTALAPLSSLSEAELALQYGFALKAEERRLAAKAAKS